MWTAPRKPVRIGTRGRCPGFGLGVFYFPARTIWRQAGLAIRFGWWYVNVLFDPEDTE